MQLSEKRRTGTFCAILVTCIVCSMLSTALTTALPQIMVDFGVDTVTGQWLTSVYSLVMGILILVTPFLIRRLPTRRLYLLTLTVFILGLALCGFTRSFPVMMAGRILQAAGNGVMVSLGQVVLLTIYPKEKRGSIMGVYGLAIGAAPVLAPTLAGLIVDAFGWRMIFCLVLIISLLAWILTAVTFGNVLETGKEKFDTLSLTLCAAGYSGILLGAGNLGRHGLLEPQVWLPLLIGFLGAGCFIYRQLKLPQPFLELRILKTAQFRTAVIASMLMYASMMAASILLPIYVQSVRGHSATVSGLVTMPGSLAMALVSPFSGKAYDKMGIRKVFLLGSILLTISSGGMISLGLTTPLPWVAVLNVLRNIAIGCMMMPFVTWGMSGLEDRYVSHGTALLTSLRTVAGSFGSAVFVAVVSMVAQIVQNSRGDIGSLGMQASQEAQVLADAQAAGMRAAFLGLTLIGLAELFLAWRSCFRRD